MAEDAAEVLASMIENKNYRQEEDTENETGVEEEEPEDMEEEEEEEDEEGEEEEEEDDDEEEVFIIERIVRLERDQGRARVKWAGYANRHNTWEPIEHIQHTIPYLQYVKTHPEEEEEEEYEPEEQEEEQEEEEEMPPVRRTRRRGAQTKKVTVPPTRRVTRRRAVQLQEEEEGEGEEEEEEEEGPVKRKRTRAASKRVPQEEGKVAGEKAAPAVKTKAKKRRVATRAKPTSEAEETSAEEEEPSSSSSSSSEEEEEEEEKEAEPRRSRRTTRQTRANASKNTAKKKKNKKEHKLTPSGVATLRSAAVAAVRDAADDEKPAVVVQVVHVYRFMVNHTFEAVTKCAIPEDVKYAYDVVVSDGEHKAKLLLDPALNDLVVQGALQRSSIISTSEYSLRFDETRVDAQGFLILHGLDVLERVHDGIITRTDYALTYARSARNSRERRHVPVCGMCDFYSELFNDNGVSFTPAPDEDGQDPLGAFVGVPDFQFVLDPENTDHDTMRIELAREAAEGAEFVSRRFTNPQSVVHITDIESKGRQMERVGKPILARVIAVGRATPYIQRNNQTNRYPVNMEMYVTDGTGTMKVVLWNGNSRKYHDVVDVGSIVLLKGWKFGNRGGRYANEKEIKLNFSNPKGTLQVLPHVPRKHPPPPMPTFSIVPVAQTVRVPDGQLIDVMGAITRVGPLLRERYGPNNALRDYRWVCIADASAKQCLPVKLHPDSRPLPPLEVGAVVMITNVALVTIGELLGSASQRSYAARVEPFSSVFSAEQASQFVPAAVKAAAKWAGKSKTKKRLASFAPTYTWETSPVPSGGDGDYDEVKVTPVVQVDEVAAALAPRECRTVYVQGYVEGVREVKKKGEIELRVRDLNGDSETRFTVTDDLVGLEHVVLGVGTLLDGGGADEGDEENKKTRKGRKKKKKKKDTVPSSALARTLARLCPPGLVPAQQWREACKAKAARKGVMALIGGMHCLFSVRFTREAFDDVRRQVVTVHFARK